MTLPRLLLLVTGSTMEEISANHGDFDVWFRHALKDDAELDVCFLHRGDEVPALERYAGMVITGSPASVTEWEPWMELGALAIQGAAQLDLPVLGVCFGHQLMARALGGRVAPNPAGREIGTVDVVLTRPGSTDPVLGPLFPSFRIQATHVDSVVDPPPDAEILARTAQEGCAAMRIGKRLYGVQFHPEMNATLMRRYISHRSKTIDAERGSGAADKLYMQVHETPAGATILKRFVKEVVVPRARPGARRTSVRIPRVGSGTYREAYVTADDGHDIFYNEVGIGSPTVMFMDGLGCDQYAWKYLAEDLRAHHHVLRWNYPGHGRSPPPRGWPDENSKRLSCEGLAHDAIRVMGHAGVDKAVLCGHSLGVQVALETWHQHPDRVAGLILVCGSYGRPLRSFHGHALGEKLFPAIEATFQRAPWVTRLVWKTLLDTELAYQVAIRTEVNGRLVKREDFIPYFRHLANVDPLLFVAMLAYASRHTAESYLKDIDVPVLIVAGEHDTFTPAHLSDHMYRHIKGSELLNVPTGSHTAPIEIPELVGLRVEKFLRTHVMKGIAPVTMPTLVSAG